MPGGVGPPGGGITGWQDGSGIGSGLSRPSPAGNVLRRSIGDEERSSSGTGNTKLTELILRFLRLSAMVASELGREVRGEEEEPAPRSNTSSSTEQGWENVAETQAGLSPLPPPASPSTARAVLQAENRMYASALRPSREWYLLLAGLLTRAVLEGYLTAGWRGAEAVECLLTVGLGIVEPSGKPTEAEDEFEEFDPDELPSLPDAAKMLFPALRSSTTDKGQAEEEYELEMEERLRRVSDPIPTHRTIIMNPVCICVVLRHPCIYPGFINAHGRPGVAISCRTCGACRPPLLRGSSQMAWQTRARNGQLPSPLRRLNALPSCSTRRKTLQVAVRRTPRDR